MINDTFFLSDSSLDTQFSYHQLYHNKLVVLKEVIKSEEKQKAKKSKPPESRITTSKQA